MPFNPVVDNLRRAKTLIGNFITPPVEASPAVAEEARKYIGQGEVGGNNRGAFVRSLGGREGDPWCSSFVSQMTKNVGEDVFGYLPMARQWLNKAREAGMVVDEPQTGDIAVFSRGNPNSSQGHVGIVDYVTKDKIVTIEGNVGEYPARVKRVVYDKSNMPRLLGYVRTPSVEEQR
jgi:uncharacterized protein (TIGR02594 family)